MDVLPESMVMKKVKRVIFYLRHYGYTELEWVMPLLYSYKLRNVSVTVLLPQRADTVRHTLMLEWLANYTEHVLYGSDSMDADWRLRIKKLLTFGEKTFVLKYLSKFFLVFWYYLIAIKMVSWYFDFLSTKKMRRVLKDFDIVYCPEGSFPRKMPYGLSKLIWISSKMLKKPLVGYLKSTYSDIRDLTTSNNGLDLLFVLSEMDKEVCEKAGIPAIVLGAQRFTDAWILEVSRYFSQHQECIELRKAFANKPVVLVLLKNRTGLVQADISAEAHLSYRIKVFQALVRDGFYLLIKPHPSENSLPLEKALETIPRDSFSVSEIPVQYLATLAACSVCEMPTNSLLDSIAAGKKSYWPYNVMFDEVKGLDKEEMVSRYFSKGFPENFIKLVELQLPNQTDELYLEDDLKHRFERIVNTHVNINAVIAACEQAVLK